MARFRKITVQMWLGGSFQRLSPLPPCGQALWLYLLTNPDTVAIPGLYRSGEAQMAEALGWDMKAFRKAFREVFREGMAEADWKARVIWVPKAIEHDPPQSPNAVKGWSKWMDEIPECPLKDKAVTRLKAFAEGMGKAFEEAFPESYRQPLPTQDSGVRTQESPLPPRKRGDTMLRRLTRGGSPPNGHGSWDSYFAGLAFSGGVSAEEAKAAWIAEKESA